MGFYSWITSDTHKSIAAHMNRYKDCPKRVYLLNPFGEPYIEDCYDGLGHFGGQNAYVLVAKWNRPELCKDKDGNWLSNDAIMDIGIDIACYAEDEIYLEYPIKITEYPVPYESVEMSPRCPYQGYFYDFYDDEGNEIVYDEEDREIRRFIKDVQSCKDNKAIIECIIKGVLSYECAKKLTPDKEILETMLAKNHQTPVEILLELAEKSKPRTKCEVSCNPSATNKVLDMLLKTSSSEPYIVKHVMKHKNYQMPSHETKKRIGIAKGKITIPDDFDKWSDEIVESFNLD